MINKVFYVSWLWIVGFFFCSLFSIDKDGGGGGIHTPSAYENYKKFTV